MFIYIYIHSNVTFILYKLNFHYYNPDPNIAKRNILAAMCVQKSSVRHVLQFTPFNVACYVLHRSVSRVIHGNELLYIFNIY